MEARPRHEGCDNLTERTPHTRRPRHEGRRILESNPYYIIWLQPREALLCYLLIIGGTRPAHRVPEERYEPSHVSRTET